MVDIGNAIVVVAHPDDEVLWFSSVIDRCRRVLVSFGHSPNSSEALNLGRAKLMDSYPLPNVKFLRLKQSDAFQKFDWEKPLVNDGRLQLYPANRSYDENTETLITVLASELEGATLVFTHNPWGEYGHEEHVQVFNAVNALRKTMDFQLYVAGYVSNRSIPLMSRSQHFLGGDPIVQATNRELAAEIKQLYVDNNCWTWLPEYEWPESEIFYPALAVATPTSQSVSATVSSTIPLNYVTHNLIQSVPRKIARKLVPASIKPVARKFLKR